MMFIDEYLPIDAFDKLALYKENTDVFERLNTERYKCNYIRFWSAVKGEATKFHSLADFAMEMYNIPAIPRLINMNKLLRLEEELSKSSSTCDKMLLISLFINENA